MTLSAPAPVKPESPDKTGNGHQPPGGNGHYHGNGGGSGDAGTGWPDEAPPPEPLPRKRSSVWPFLLDVGLVMVLFGLIITGRFLSVIGAVIFVVALAGWIREARTDYSRLKD